MSDQPLHIVLEYFSHKRWFERFRTTSPNLEVPVISYRLTKTSLVAVLCLTFFVFLLQKFSPSEARGEVNNAPDVITSNVDRNASLQAAPGYPILVGAGDISSCANDNDLKTAQLIQSIFASGATGKVITLGDNAYENGSNTNFTNCFAPTWGAFKNKIAPAVGNHEYLTSGASGYFNYFGSQAGVLQRGYYSYNLGTWHIIVINSNCSKVGGCQIGSPQERWLRTDLAANPRFCTLAYWHHPLFSSGSHGNYVSLKPIWQALYDYNADVVLAGHDHDYERFAPQTAAGILDYQRGIREIVVGTGGKSHGGFSTMKPNSKARDSTTFGVIKLTLGPTYYAWQFLPIVGQTFTDAGTYSCH